MHFVRRAIVWVYGSAILGLPAFSSNAARADMFIWREECVSDNWYACCEHLDGWYNNWQSTPIGGELDCPGPYPEPPDDVDLLTYSVYLNQYATVWSLVTSGPFRLLNGDVAGQLSVYTSATFNYVFYFDEGAVVGFSGWPSSFEINYAVEFRSSTLKNIVAADFNVNGGAAAIVSGAGDIVMGQAVLRVRPLATFEFDTDASIVNNPFTGGYRVDNEGLFMKAAGTGTSRVDVPLYNTATVEVRTGTLQLNAETGTSSGAFDIDTNAVLEFGAHTLGPGAIFSGDGLVRVPDPGHVILAAGAAPSIADFEMAGTYSVVNGSGDLQITQTLNWLGGNFQTSGATTLAATCVSTLSGSAGKAALFGTLNNAGTLTWSGDGGLNLAFGVLNNLAGASFTVTTDADAPNGGIINNAGLFTKVGSVGETTVTATFSNTGLVDVQSGRLVFSDYTQTDGVTDLDGGDIGFGSAGEFLGGTLTGSGTVFGSVTNNGATVSPGHSAGTIAVNNTYTQTTAGTLEIQIGGPTPGSEYDRLVVSGVAMLDGTIRVSLIDGYVPEVGSIFTVMTFLLGVGDFSTKIVPTGIPGRRFAVHTSDTLVRVVVCAAAGATADLDCDGDVDGDDFLAWEDCLLGPNNGLLPGCEIADLDGDEDVDLADFSEFQGAFAGP